MKKNILPIVAIATVIILGSLYVSHLRSQVRYADIACPSCGSGEVLDFGLTDEGDQRAHCFVCKQEFTIRK